MTLVLRRAIQAYTGCMSNTRLVIALGTATALLMAGCDSADGGDLNGSPVGSTQTTGAIVLAAGPTPAKVVPASRPASNRAALTVTGVRFGHHAGFDRVVFDLAGKGTPGWYASYTKNPKSPSSGKPVSIRGRSILEVRLTGLGYPADTGVKPYSGPNPIAGVHQVRQVYLTSVFEGQATGFVGVDGHNPAVRISTLTKPTRVVVDISHTR